MTIEEILRRMIEISRGNLHDIDHLVRVWAYARTIGVLEGLDGETLRTLEVAAIVHDIACPLCREKYGSTEGKLQEKEGGPLAKAFLADAGLPEAVVDRVAFLVAHHHTLTNIEGSDWQILVEADYIVNAGENGWPARNVRGFMENVCRTASGWALMASILLPQAEDGSEGTGC